MLGILHNIGISSIAWGYLCTVVSADLAFTINMVKHKENYPNAKQNL